MQSRTLQAVSKAVVAAGTAGAITTACWLLNRILDDHEPKCIVDAETLHLHTKPTSTADDYTISTKYSQQKEHDVNNSFALLPIVSESDEEVDLDNSFALLLIVSESDEEVDLDNSFALLPIVSESDEEVDGDAMDYITDYFTPPNDVCILSVSVPTLMDQLSHVSTDGIPDCRLCKAAAIKSSDLTIDEIYMDEKKQTLLSQAQKKAAAVLIVIIVWCLYQVKMKRRRRFSALEHTQGSYMSDCSHVACHLFPALEVFYKFHIFMKTCVVARFIAMTSILT